MGDEYDYDAEIDEAELEADNAMDAVAQLKEMRDAAARQLAMIDEHLFAWEHGMIHGQPTIRQRAIGLFSPN